MVGCVCVSGWVCVCEGLGVCVCEGLGVCVCEGLGVSVCNLHPWRGLCNALCHTQSFSIEQNMFKLNHLYRLDIMMTFIITPVCNSDKPLKLPHLT